MPTAVWVVVGVLGGLASGRAARLVAGHVDGSMGTARGVRITWFASGLFGAATALLGSAAALPDATVLAIVAVLTVVQAPFDLRSHRLSRPVTIAATITIVAIVVGDAVASASPRRAIEVVGWAAVVVVVYASLHRVSPRSLGWGDVLLVVPLSVAITFVDADRLVVWQLLAATSGAIHAAIQRVRHGETVIPFGPHLLGSAWVVLATSV